MLFFIFILSNANSESLKIKSIEITGNKHFSQTEIRKVLRIKEEDFFSYKELNNNLQNVLQLYSKKGFYLVKILPPKIIPDKSGKNVNIQIQIIENQKLEVAEIQFFGNRYFSDDKLKAIISTKNGQQFSFEKINSDLHTIVAAYGERGYPFCEVTLDSSYIENDKISILLKIHENDFVRISKLNFQGNEITKEKTLKLITNFDENTIYKNSRIENAERKLLRKKYISDAEILPISKRELLIKILEKKTNYFQGVLGFASKEEKTFLENLTGFFNLSFLNMAGTERDIFLSWKKTDVNSSQFYISYKEPFIFDQQISVKGTFKRRTIDTVYVNSELGFETFFLLNSFGEIGLKFLFQNVLEDSITSHRKGLGGELEINKLDFPANPRKGFLLSSSYLIDWKSKQSYKQKVAIGFQHNFQIFRNNVLSIRGRTNLIFSSDSLSEYEFFEFGGYDNLRGFVDNQFSSKKFCLINAEYRYLLSRYSRVFLFTDYAYCDEYKNLFGCGFGVRLKSKIGILKIDYGVGYQNNEWTNPLEGMLHFGIETEF